MHDNPANKYPWVFHLSKAWMPCESAELASCMSGQFRLIFSACNLTNKSLMFLNKAKEKKFLPSPLAWAKKNVRLCNRGIVKKLWQQCLVSVANKQLASLSFLQRKKVLSCLQSVETFREECPFFCDWRECFDSLVVNWLQMLDPHD